LGLRPLSSVALQLCGLLAFLQYEGDGHVDLVTGDVPVLDQHVLVLDPCTLYIAQSLCSTFDGRVNRILNALAETALISVTRATVIRYSFLRLPLKDFLPLHLGFANASVL
jgi:hypothetical protein